MFIHDSSSPAAIWLYKVLGKKKVTRHFNNFQCNTVDFSNATGFKSIQMNLGEK